MTTIATNSARREAGPNWLITLADLMALLLTFFVLIFSMSTIQKDRWNAIVAGMSAIIPDVVPATETVPPAKLTIPIVDEVLGLDLGYLEAILHDLLGRDAVLARAIVSRLPDTLVVSLPSDLLFSSGSDTLRGGSQHALFLVGGFLGNLRNDVAIIGHTDPQPIASNRFPSNWELSLARALTVSAALRQAGYSRPLPILGAADSRFADIANDIDEPRRHALARRVDILIRDTRGH